MTVLETYCPCCGHHHWSESLLWPGEDADGKFMCCPLCSQQNRPRDPNVKPWMDNLQKIQWEAQQGEQLTLL